mmetsp:Transcript_31858/g.68691  ORF Transcript_31858/g.68691 Transcript_31858/m.68691 type:complete len:209 (+) Transcript_31858:1452-2078(+)
MLPESVSSCAEYESILACTLASLGPPTLRMRLCREATSVCMVRKLGATVSTCASISSRRLCCSASCSFSPAESSQSAAVCFRRAASSASCSAYRATAMRAFSAPVASSRSCFCKSFNLLSLAALWERHWDSSCCSCATRSSRALTASALYSSSTAAPLALLATPAEALPDVNFMPPERPSLPPPDIAPDVSMRLPSSVTTLHMARSPW